MIPMNLKKKITKKRTLAKNTWYNWYNWLTNYVPELIKMMRYVKDKDLSLFQDKHNQGL